MKRQVVCAVGAAVLAFAVTASAADVERTIPFTKRVPLAGTRVYRFSIHDAASNGNELWSEEKRLEAVGRVLKHSLGSVVSFDDGAAGPPDFSMQCWPR